MQPVDETPNSESSQNESNEDNQLLHGPTEGEEDTISSSETSKLITVSTDEGSTPKGPSEDVSTITQQQNGTFSKRIMFLSLLSVYLTVLIDLIAFGIVIPLLPFYAIKLHASGQWLGIIASFYSVFSLFSTIVLGRLSDKYGRRPIILVSLVGNCGSSVLLALSKNLWMICLARAIAGISGGSVSVAQAYVADLSTPEERAKKMGMLGACIGAGIVVGPAIGGVLSPYGFSTAAYAAAGVAGGNAVLSFFVLKESTQRSTKNSSKFTIANIKKIFSNKAVVVTCLAQFFIGFGQMIFQVTLPLLGAEYYGMSASGLGWLFAIFGTVMMLTQAGLVSLLRKVLGEKVMAIGSCFGVGASQLGLPFVPNLIWIYGLIGVMGLSRGIVMPTLPSLLSVNTPAEHQSCGAASRAVAPLFMGETYDVWYKLPFIVGGITGLLSAAVLLFVPSKKDNYQIVADSDVEGLKLGIESTEKDECKEIEMSETPENPAKSAGNNLQMEGDKV